MKKITCFLLCAVLLTGVLAVPVLAHSGYTAGAEQVIHTQPQPGQTEPAAGEESTQPTASHSQQENAPEERQNVPVSLLTAVLIGVVSFSAAITATVIILKKKK